MPCTMCQCYFTTHTLEPCPKDIPKQPPHLLCWVMKIKLSQITEQNSRYLRLLLRQNPWYSTILSQNNNLVLDQFKARVPAHGPLCAWAFLCHQAVLLLTKWLKTYSPTAASAEAGAPWDASQPHRDCPVQVRPGKVQHDHCCRCGHDESLTWTGAQQAVWAGSGKAQKSLAAFSPCQFSATSLELGLASCVPMVSGDQKCL